MHNLLLLLKATKNTQTSLCYLTLHQQYRLFFILVCGPDTINPRVASFGDPLVFV